MTDTKKNCKWKVGLQIRVRTGVQDPDYPDLTIGGWTGTISEFEKGNTKAILVRWSDQTLEGQSKIYRARCERDGFDSNEMWLLEDDLEPDQGGPPTIEPPQQVVTPALSMKDQDDRIRYVFKLTSDDPLPSVDDQSLTTYYKYLAEKLTFPFEATYSVETGPFESRTERIKVVRLLDIGKYPDEFYGLFCRARRQNRNVDVPLCNVNVAKGNPNRTLVEDYSSWFVNA